MVVYNYTVHDASGRICKSRCDAQSQSALRLQLKAMGYTVNSITPKSTYLSANRRKNIKPQDIVNMCRQFSTMYGAGLDLMECLSSLAEENESEKLSTILLDIRGQIAKGSNISDAFAGYPKVFGDFFCNMLAAGETTGKFDYVLGTVAGYIEKQYELKRKIRGAMAYPLMVLITLLAVVGAIMVFVVPVFSEVYQNLGVSLPGPTIALIFIADNLGYVTAAMIALFGLGWILFRNIRNIPAITTRLDKIKLALPVYHKIVLLRFLQTLNLAVSAGVILSDAISLARNVAGNSIASEAADMIDASIKRGGTITEAVKLHGFFPQSIGHAFAAGEKSGNLEEILNKFTIGIERDVDSEIKKLITRIEPLVIVILSLIVGFVMIAIYLPIFDIMKVIHK